MRNEIALPPPAYRPDVDGLRAVAVAAVVGFHAFPGRLPSGFVGVDVFFVISGYLITSILLRDLARGRYSIAEFYVRRVRRIFPALALVLAAVLAVGWFTLLPEEYARLGKHAAGGAAFAANLVFWAEEGYFDVAGELKPLLHLWSLGVEEQFYLIWPLLLAFAWRRGWVRAATLGVAAASFAANLALTVAGGNDAFFLPVSRFWELMAGAWLAQRADLSARLTSGGRDGVSVLGAALLAAGFLLIHDGRAFPGWWALLPVLGTACLIFAGPQAWLNRRVLSLRPLVFVGLISYPLYLWHWPLLSFARIFDLDPSPALRLGLCAVAAALSWLTYELVEKRVRHARPRLAMPGLVGAVAVAGVAGLVVLDSRGAADARFDGAAAPVADLSFAASVSPGYAQTAIGRQVFPRSDPGRDFFADTGGGSRVAVLGDSHANRLFAGLTMASARGALNLGRGSCPPFLGTSVRWRKTGEDLGCQPVIDNALGFAARAPEVGAIVLTAYLGGFGVDRDLIDLASGEAIAPEAALARTLARLAQSGKPVLVALDVPRLPSECARRGFPIWRGVDTGACVIPVSRQAAAEARLSRAVASAAAGNVSVVRLSAALCRGGQCGEIDPRRVLYDRDGHHLTVAGARRVGAVLDRALPSVP